MNHILQGSVRKVGDRVRISAQLINPADGSQIWSDVYERRLEDIFAIQEEIARTVAQSLRLTLATGAVGGTRNFAAYDEFLAGRAGLNTNGGSPAAFPVEHLERAVALDPEYITAWVWLIDAYTRQLFVRHLNEGARERQLGAIKRVEALAPDSRYAQIARSYGALLEPDLAEADRLLSASLDAPSDIGLRTQLRYGQFLGVVGRRADSLKVLRQVQAADPLDVFSRMQLMQAYRDSGDYAQAREELETILRAPGGATPLALAQRFVLAMDSGDRAAMLKEIDTYRAFNEPVGSVLAAHRDNLQAAMPELAALLQDDRFNQGPFVLTEVARLAGYLGSPDVALDALRRMPALGLSFETWAGFLWGNTLGEMRQTPGFKDFVRELGLVDYWRDTGNWGDFCKPVGDRRLRVPVTMSEAPGHLPFLQPRRPGRGAAVRARLGTRGLSVWWDQTLTAGEAFDEVTEKALQERQGRGRAVVEALGRIALGARRGDAGRTRDGTLVPVHDRAVQAADHVRAHADGGSGALEGRPGDPSWQAFVAGLRSARGEGRGVGHTLGATRHQRAPGRRSSDRASDSLIAVGDRPAGARWWRRLVARTGGSHRALNLRPHLLWLRPARLPSPCCLSST